MTGTGTTYVHTLSLITKRTNLDNLYLITENINLHNGINQVINYVVMI